MILMQCESCGGTKEINMLSASSAVPIGWIEVRIAKQERMSQEMMFERMFESPQLPKAPTAFCSKQCLVTWAMLSEAVEEK